MTRKILLALAVVSLFWAGAMPAIAQSDPESDLRNQGYFIEPGITPDAGSIGRTVQAMRDAGFDFYSISIASPEQDTQLVADQVVSFFGSGTVIAMGPDSIGATSTEFSDADLDAALEAIPNDATDAEVVASFAQSLAPQVFDGATTNSGSTSTSGGVPWGFIGLVGLAVGGVYLLVRSGSKREEKAREADISEAREEIQAQLDVIANEILEDTDAVTLSDNPEVRTYFERASATYATASDELAAADSLNELAEITDRLDEARWQLAAADALRDGKPVPPKPQRERATCFFDPTHEPATQKATLRTKAGDKEVMVCDEDAERLRKGEEPRPRMINVGGRPTPAPMAPRSYGGGGFGGLDVFQILVGGLARSGGFGDFLGGRPRSTRNRASNSGRTSPWNTVTPRYSRPTVTRSPRTRSSAGRSRASRSRSPGARSSRSRSFSSRSRSSGSRSRSSSRR